MLHFRNIQIFDSKTGDNLMTYCWAEELLDLLEELLDDILINWDWEYIS